MNDPQKHETLLHTANQEECFNLANSIAKRGLSVCIFTGDISDKFLVKNEKKLDL